MQIKFQSISRSGYILLGSCLAGLIGIHCTSPGAATQSDPFQPYSGTVPESSIRFEMLPIPAGKATIGSPAGEKGRKPDEGPVHTVQIDAFWMGRYEVTWDEFERFVGAENVDAVTKPSPAFTDMSFGMGKAGYPAINITQHAALYYCKWLTEKTGQFYRLPTEAEWEYACRAGSSTAYYFGDDAAELADYAWYSKNSKEKYQQPGQKKPNKWGLHDMHGNVAEWTLDQYLPEFYSSAAASKPNAWAEPTKLYPHSVRGGSWDDGPADLRSAARKGSDPSWKQRDPQLPKSNWWMTDASFVGFRIVRPLKKPSPKEIKNYFKQAIQDL
ncbi:formylglycine-generating enzyme family protein [Flavihumibacter sp. UBA7668]|uniref:formylglycine-generating enzyme family protein n=1 Tax=Flavihumibacter sp. UBA7668 TaxID=1946542 RepID=UPI0025BD5FD8|nr:formylglycine-generating enzyme family protein [Flavihumibacter sp. UBA7668]